MIGVQYLVPEDPPPMVASHHSVARITIGMEAEALQLQQFRWVEEACKKRWLES